MKKLLMVFLCLAMLTDISAQCSMCGAVAESAQRNGSEVAEGLNAGILYLMGVPYALLIALGILMFRRLNRNRAEPE